MEKLEATREELPQLPEPDLQTILSCAHSCEGHLPSSFTSDAHPISPRNPSQEAHSVDCLLLPFLEAPNVSIKCAEVFPITLKKKILSSILSFPSQPCFLKASAGWWVDMVGGRDL